MDSFESLFGGQIGGTMGSSRAVSSGTGGPTGAVGSLLDGQITLGMLGVLTLGFVGWYWFTRKYQGE